MLKSIITFITLLISHVVNFKFCEEKTEISFNIFFSIQYHIINYSCLVIETHRKEVPVEMKADIGII